LPRRVRIPLPRGFPFLLGDGLTIEAGSAAMFSLALRLLPTDSRGPSAMGRSSTFNSCNQIIVLDTPNVLNDHNAVS